MWTGLSKSENDAGTSPDRSSADKIDKSADQIAKSADQGPPQNASVSSSHKLIRLTSQLIRVRDELIAEYADHTEMSPDQIEQPAGHME